MNIPEFDEIIEPNDQTEARREHLNKLREIVGNVYPNKFERTKISGDEDTISNLLKYKSVAEIAAEFDEHKSTLSEGEKPDQELKAQLNEKLKAFGNVRISGRLAVPPRVMGKAAFVHLSDGKNRLQIYVRKQDAKAMSNDTLQPIDEEVKAWELFGFLDHGDFIGVEGYLFLTNTGELSVHVETLQFLSKALLPMPDKMHGIVDPELQRRFRYADLIASSLQVEHEGLTTREVFERRAKLISGMRRFLDDAGYIEVETPMLTPKATGAAATPFETHHNALDIPLYARIAPELYLKRLVVGGFEKVYELNRNFRNEGLSHKHNPEFTMLEFYCAYMDVNGMMKFAEEMIQESVKKATGGSLQVKYGGNEIDFSNFEKFTMIDSITKNLPDWFTYIDDLTVEDDFLSDSIKVNRAFEFISLIREEIKGRADEHQVFLKNNPNSQGTPEWRKSFDRVTFWKNGESNLMNGFWQKANEKVDLQISKGKLSKTTNVGKIVEGMFEDFVEPILGKGIFHQDIIVNPTFIIDYPKSISPLSKASPENPNIAERFELFINGMECANGFSELNDPQEQYERFVDQMKERESGDHEAMVLDEDYIRALAYGMPPAAGIGIGIDRLVMLLTNKHSIRDVILFPHMRPEKRDHEKENTPTEESSPTDNPSN